VFPSYSQRPSSAGTRRSVLDDWIRALPKEKTQIFDSIVRRWESSFAMTSVALNEALSMRARGELVCAQQQVSISAVLLSRLSTSLVSFCAYLGNRGRYIRQIPNVEPLHAEFFRGNTAQTAATWNGILHVVIFGDRSRFLRKLRILSNTVEHLDHEFNDATRVIMESGQPGACWSLLDHLHYDYNTCLRETEVVLKSFLRALPSDQLATFAGEFEGDWPTPAGMRPRLSRVSA
jgi:hypothetical protein